MKTKRSHRMPLSWSALALLNSLSQTGAGLIFEGMKAGSAMRVLQVTVHGFRSTFRDWTAERSPLPNEVVEMALAYVILRC